MMPTVTKPNIVGVDQPVHEGSSRIPLVIWISFVLTLFRTKAPEIS